MRFGVLVALIASVVVGVTSARAEPTQDVAGWAERFTQTVLKSDPDDITAVVKEIADPRLNLEGIRSVVHGAMDYTKSQTPEYSEQFGEKDVGDFVKRINVAVKYSTNFMFYSVVVARSAKGWQVVQFNIDGNLNKILDAQWPD